MTDDQILAAVAMVFLIAIVVLAEMFERAIQDDVNEHDGYRPENEVDDGK
jgi:hypothetical protein